MSSVTAQNIKQNNNDPQYAVNPTRFVLWLLIVASIMLFAGFTSAYIVRRAEGNWMQFALPASLWISTFTILLSSVSMVWAYRAAKKDSINQVKYGLITTLLLGFIFLYSQYNAFFDLVEMGVYLSGSNVAGSFLIIIAGVHFAHILGGLLWLFIVLYQSFNFKVHKKNILNISLCNTYWHFIGLLWVYLFVFFMLYR